MNQIVGESSHQLSKCTAISNVGWRNCLLRFAQATNFNILSHSGEGKPEEKTVADYKMMFTFRTYERGVGGR